MNETFKDKSLKRIETIFKEIFLDETLEISENTSPADIEEWDSLAHITILTTIEKEFGIQFTSKDMNDIIDIQTLIDALYKFEKVNSDKNN